MTQSCLDMSSSLAALLAPHAHGDGPNPLPWPRLDVLRATRPQPPRPVLSVPLPAQGEIADIAREAGLSPSALHHEFRAVTSVSPLRYLKSLRLHRALRLMLQEGLGAAEAAFRVGYASPSQFSREFKRLFGQPPVEEVLRWRRTAASPPSPTLEA